MVLDRVPGGPHPKSTPVYGSGSQPVVKGPPVVLDRVPSGPQLNDGEGVGVNVGVNDPGVGVHPGIPGGGGVSGEGPVGGGSWGSGGGALGGGIPGVGGLRWGSGGQGVLGVRWGGLSGVRVGGWDPRGWGGSQVRVSGEWGSQVRHCTVSVHSVIL